MSIRRYFREVTHAASRLGIQGARVEIPHGKGHPRLLGTFAGRSIRAVIAMTPSDRRARLNMIADLRRMMRQVAAKP